MHKGQTQAKKSHKSNTQREQTAQSVEILVLDFGSQYTQLIARRLREFGVYTEIIPYFETFQAIQAKNPKGIILSGGPASVYEKSAYKPDPKIFELGIPILGICYGMQYIAHHFGGVVIRAKEQEFGKAVLEIKTQKKLQKLQELHFEEFSAKKFPQMLDAIVDLWEDSVRVSHSFLKEKDIADLKHKTKQRLQTCEKILVATDKRDFLGFIGGENNEIEMLFVAPKHFKCGIGKALIQKACEKYFKGCLNLRVECSEQNENALGFYHALGFEIVSRSKKDSSGRNFPVLHLEAQVAKIINNKQEQGREVERLEKSKQNKLFKNIKQDSVVWMSHADKVQRIPKGFVELARSGNTHYCAIADFKRQIYALQFHPEVAHSEYGGEILRNFAVEICATKTDWNMKNFAEMEIDKLRQKVLGTAEAKLFTLNGQPQRCAWAKAHNREDAKLYEDYHDKEWGIPVHEDRKLFEMLVLENFQAGLSWLTILKKREAFRMAFDGFEPKKIAHYDAKKVESLMQNRAIIRNRLKIEATIANAKAFLEIQREFGSFDKFLWSYVKNKPLVSSFKDIKALPTYTKLSDKIAKDLKRRGFRFVGSVGVYAYLQSIGLVCDHTLDCAWHRDNKKRQRNLEGKKDVANGDSRGVDSKASKVLCAVSGGVDSSVVAALLYRAIGENLIPIFVDTGLLREGEREAVEGMFRENLKIPLIVADAKKLFLGRLKGITDPEKKRKIIGETFIEVFERESQKHNTKDEIRFLAQGTLYPDVIESVSVKGPSKTIKSHHNVGGLPDWMKFELIEPLRELFKDEVRALGKELGMPKSMLMRHPFPGPGLAIRIMGVVNEESLGLLRKADSIFIEELQKHKLYHKVWQAFCVLLNVNSVGVMGDNRTYENTICLRAVVAVDGMTASFAHLPHAFLESVSNRIINEVEGINRVVYDITSKPPGTIEWE